MCVFARCRSVQRRIFHANSHRQRACGCGPACESGTAPAHEGHDHGPAAPAARADVAPRGEASSDAFELVAVAQGETLFFFLDRFASNEPVRDATLTVEAPGGSVEAEAAGGAYRIKAPWLAKPGHTDLIVTVTAGI